MKDLNENIIKNEYFSNSSNYLIIDDSFKEDDIVLNIKENEYFKLNILLTKNIKKVLNLKINLSLNSNLECFFADFNKANVELNLDVNLNDIGSKVYFISSTLANNLTKKYNINFIHNSKYTESKIDCFGVSLNEGNITYNCISHIKKDCVKSKASQSNKIILFDKESKGKGYPILKIDCDDIIANHGCAIGNLNDDHIFYLQSRGIPLNEARKLITLGYLKPIERYFNDEEKKLIEEGIKEGFLND